MTFNPHDWYWFVGDDRSKVYSSARNTYVDPNSDQGYRNWMQNVYMGHPAVQFQHESEVWYYVKEFMPAWMWNGTSMSQPSEGNYQPDQLKAYAEIVRETTASGGMTAEGIPIKTDDSARLKISNARIAAVADKHYSTTILGSDGNLYPVDDAQIIAISDDVIAFGTKLADTYATVHDGADSGTITTLKQIDDAFAAVNKSITEGKSNRYRGK
jgi:hypothetical protein